jgi:hypothetical protein
MIIWQGFGFLGAIIPILFYVAVGLLMQAILGKDYLAHHSWPGALGTLLGAVAVWFLALMMDKPGRVLLDPQTGEKVELKQRHTLFFIPLKYLAIIFAVVALGMLVFKTDSSL